MKTLLASLVATICFAIMSLASLEALADSRWSCSPQPSRNEVTESRWELAVRPFILVMKSQNQQASFFSSEPNSRYPQLLLSLNPNWSPANPKFESYRQFKGQNQESSYEILIQVQSITAEVKTSIRLRERTQDGYGTASFNCLPIAPL